jgi:hypothetical protein
MELASWYGTDFFIEGYPDQRENIGGYLSYLEKDQVVCIFFNQADSSKIIARIVFDSIPVPTPVSIDTVLHSASEKELDLIQIRQDALRRVQKNEGEFFSFYQKTSYNFIPFIEAAERKVFILTGPQVSNVVVIGNDYLLTYNSSNEFLKKEKLHNSLLTFPYKSDDPEKPMTVTMHSHVVTPLITSTDICTFLLYRDFLEWDSHFVVAKKYVSIFDLRKAELVVITRKAWDKIYKDQKKRHPDK